MGLDEIVFQLEVSSWMCEFCGRKRDKECRDWTTWDIGKPLLWDH